MAKTSVITTHVTICGDGVDFTWHQGDEPFCNPNAPEGGTTSAVLAPGSNTIAVPPGSVWLSVGALVGSTNAKALRFVSGDTGMSWTAQGVNRMPVAGLSAVYITAAAAETLTLLWG